MTWGGGLGGRGQAFGEGPCSLNLRFLILSLVQSSLQQLMVVLELGPWAVTLLMEAAPFPVGLLCRLSEIILVTCLLLCLVSCKFSVNGASGLFSLLPFFSWRRAFQEA